MVEHTLHEINVQNLQSIMMVRVRFGLGLCLVATITAIYMYILATRNMGQMK